MKKSILLLVPLMLVSPFPAASHAQDAAHQGDVTDVTVIRRVEQHPQAGRLWQPFVIQGEKRKQLVVAFGAMIHGKKDMGDILASVSKDDGQTWETPVAVFDHSQRQGAIQFAYANPVLRAVWDSGTADTPRTHIQFGKLTVKP